jgi:hypothetical protein
MVFCGLRATVAGGFILKQIAPGGGALLPVRLGLGVLFCLPQAEAGNACSWCLFLIFAIIVIVSVGQFVSQ